MTVNAITDTKKGRTGIAPTYLHTTQNLWQLNETFEQITISPFTNKDTNVLMFFLYSLTTVRAFSFRVVWR